MDTGSLNYRWSQTLIAGLVATGIQNAVLSPGSRSTPLTLAALRQPNLTCRMVLDERSAAFFALGIAKATQKPVIVIATSGSAPANWYPAIIEASQSGHPLILISADRPPELIGFGANQTINQASMFGEHVRASHLVATPFPEFDPAYLYQLARKAVEQTLWPSPGPVHLNAPFREPLLPLTDTAAPILTTQPMTPPKQAADVAVIANWISATKNHPGVIICGEIPSQPELPETLNRLAQRLGCPILAETLSNLRFGKHHKDRLCTRYDVWLNQHDWIERFRPKWVLRFGAFPVTRNLQAYLGKAPLQMIVAPTLRWPDPQYRTTHLLRTDALTACETIYTHIPENHPDDWARKVLETDAAITPSTTWPIKALLASLPEDSHVFLGNSLTIRQVDSNSGISNKNINFHGNRGVSGIDGNLSTALGIAAAHGNVVALLGDLTTQHDLGSLALAQGLNAIVIVFNNGGGGIFDHLPQARLPEFIEGWRTPQQIDFSHIAKAFNLGYAWAGEESQLIESLEDAITNGGPHLIEYQLDTRKMG